MANNLVENFIKSATCCGEPLRVAIDGLNEALGTRYRVNKLSEWRGGRAVPDNVRRYMMSIALQSVLRNHGINVMPLTDNEVSGIIEGLMPPQR